LLRAKIIHRFVKRHFVRWITVALIMLVVPAASAFEADAKARPPVRLVLQITVDGLRGDLLERYANGFGKDGFRYFLEKGTVYTNAHYQHANTETIVGHTTLATGAFPSTHGMVGNVWFDREEAELAYNIEDADAPLLPSREVTIEGEQVDPAQKRARTKGRSPRVILAPTLGDTLSAYYAGRSKVFGVSGKDRSAVSMAGHTGKAFWFSTDNGDFVTSKYYYDAYPNWVRRWNDQRRAEKYAGTEWRLSSAPDTYLLAEQDDRPYEMDLKGFGRTFPHRFADVGNKLFATQILVSPVGDELLLDFSKALIVNEQLGCDSVPDYLSISFSSVDAVNHFFGPSSLENEEVVRRLDRTLADLVKFIDKRVGLEQTLIVLSADHGMADMPEYMSALGYDAGRLVPGEIVAAANQAGRRLGIEEVVRFFYRPYMYLNEERIAAAKLDHANVADAIAKALTDMKGVELAVAAGNLEMHQRSSLHNQVRRNQHVTRSGDIYVIQQPYWFLFDEGPIPAMHGSPWRYDTHVPIVFFGPGIDSRTVHRQVHPVDVAPTVAAVLGMTAPASASGTVLVEVVE
jgi:predicted AlkP superfamily pyrophosphatase or phosphodiesterase